VCAITIQHGAARAQAEVEAKEQKFYTKKEALKEYTLPMLWDIINNRTTVLEE